MATLMAVYNSEGCVGRCDANCYLSTGKKCRCICGGRNHGVGVERALENNAARAGYLDSDLERFAEAHDLRVGDLIVIDRLELPDARKARSAAYMKLNQMELPFYDGLG